MKKFLLAGAMVLLFAACAQEQTVEQATLLAPPSKLRIEQIFRSYKTGDFSRFVNFMYSYKDKPERYQSQVVNMLKLQAVQRQQDSMQIADIQPAQIVMSEVQPVAEVYLNFSYTNGLQEEVMIPFIYEQGKWWLR